MKKRILCFLRINFFIENVIIVIFNIILISILSCCCLHFSPFFIHHRIISTLLRSSPPRLRSNTTNVPILGQRRSNEKLEPLPLCRLPSHSRVARALFVHSKTLPFPFVNRLRNQPRPRNPATADALQSLGRIALSRVGLAKQRAKTKRATRALNEPKCEKQLHAVALQQLLVHETAPFDALLVLPEAIEHFAAPRDQKRADEADLHVGGDRFAVPALGVLDGKALDRDVVAHFLLQDLALLGFHQRQRPQHAREVAAGEDVEAVVVLARAQADFAERVRVELARLGYHRVSHFEFSELEKSAVAHRDDFVNESAFPADLDLVASRRFDEMLDSFPHFVAFDRDALHVSRHC